jgi:hypothetical protein
MSSSLFASGPNRTSAPCNLRRTFCLTKAHPWSHSLPSVGLLVQVIVVSAIAHWAEFLFLLRTGRRRTHISCSLAGRWNGHGHPHVVRGLGEELGGVANLAGRPWSRGIPRKRGFVWCEAGMEPGGSAAHVSSLLHSLWPKGRCTAILFYYLCSKIMGVSFSDVNQFQLWLDLVKKSNICWIVLNVSTFMCIFDHD